MVKRVTVAGRSGFPSGRGRVLFVTAARAVEAPERRIGPVLAELASDRPT